jgi:hypothetical protein
VIVSAPTANPDSAWVAQQARNATMQMSDWNLSVAHLIIDHDSKFTGSFDAVFEAEGAKILRVGPAAPNMSPHAERWVRTLRQECLDHFVICGEAHLRHVVNEFVEHFNLERPHQGWATCPVRSRSHRGGAVGPPVPVRRGEVSLSPRRVSEALLPRGRLN